MIFRALCHFFPITFKFYDSSRFSRWVAELSTVNRTHINCTTINVQWYGLAEEFWIFGNGVNSDKSRHILLQYLVCKNQKVDV